jgi:hypothetical protein
VEMRDLLFCSGKRCFQLMVVGSPGPGLGRASATFFNSFVLVVGRK